MAKTGKALDPLDRAILDEVERLRIAAGLSGRALAEKAGLGNNRAGIILRGEEPPATLGELDRLARALGSSASAVVRLAEAALLAGVVGEDLGEGVTSSARPRSKTGGQ